jgi:hypothetical protein
VCRLQLSHCTTFKERKIQTNANKEKINKHAIIRKEERNKWSKKAVWKYHYFFQNYVNMDITKSYNIPNGGKYTTQLLPLTLVSLSFPASYLDSTPSPPFPG